MIWIVVILAVLFVSAAGIAAFMTRRALFLNDTLENITSELRKNLDVLKVVYKNVEHKSKLEVFFNEPVVRDLLEDIKAAKNVTFVVLNTAKQFIEEQGEELTLEDQTEEEQ